MKYIKKPIEIEAIQWLGNNHREMFNFLGGEGDYMTPIGINFYIDFSKVEGGLIIKTLEGEHIAKIGDYIIKGVKGEYYPCKPDIFEITYQLVEIKNCPTPMTAVEWLIEKMLDNGIGICKEWREKAKKIEREQRINAQMDMFHHINDIPYGMAYLAKRDSAEQFCETYGNGNDEIENN